MTGNPPTKAMQARSASRLRLGDHIVCVGACARCDSAAADAAYNPRRHSAAWAVPNTKVMIMKRLLPLLTVGLALLFAPVVLAMGEATPDEAKAMAIKAAAYLTAVGPEKAFPEFSAKDGPWHDRDLYVTVMDNKAVMLAHGTNPGLIGKSMYDLKDVDGKAFSREMVAVTDTSWVTFKWQNPLTKAVELKTTFDVRVGDYAPIIIDTSDFAAIEALFSNRIASLRSCPEGMVDAV